MPDVSRWEPFSEKECATISLGLAAFAMLEMQDVEAGKKSRKEAAGIFVTIHELMMEMEGKMEHEILPGSIALHDQLQALANDPDEE